MSAQRPHRLPVQLLVERLEGMAVAMQLTVDQWEWIGMRLIPEWYGEAPPDAVACPYPPGTPDKVERLILRNKKGMALWHPDDVTWEQWTDDRSED